jgi:hypothetical protein
MPNGGVVAKTLGSPGISGKGRRGREKRNPYILAIYGFLFSVDYTGLGKQ